MTNKPSLLPLFDTMENTNSTRSAPHYLRHAYASDDYLYTLEFLKSYNGSQATFNAYRRETERLLHWSWEVVGKSVTQLKRADIEQYLHFCQRPPTDWISLKKVPRFIVKDGARHPNPQWRPFVVTQSKSANRQGKELDIKAYALSEAALREIFAITSSFFNFLIQEEACDLNPIAHIRQKSKFLRKRQGKAKIRRLSDLQWEYVVSTAEKMAAQLPERHERTLFIISSLYLMYLRISELTASERWTPRMCDFHCDHDGSWWFTVVGKGNKEREIAVSEGMLNTLKRWRQHLGLSPSPSSADQSPLLPKRRGYGAISDTSFVRKIVQACFDQSIEQLKQDGFAEEAETLLESTVHWLRHTGISDDVKHRPREHVRDDAGHSSGAITDRYIDIERRERHQSAKNKTLKKG